MNSYPVYKLNEDLDSVLTNSDLPHALAVVHEDNIYRIADPMTNGTVAIERFDDNPSYMIMVYAGNSPANRDLAALVDGLILAAGGQKVTGEELDRVMT